MSGPADSPLLSIIIPVFNREKTVGEAIRSVAAGDAPHEIIVVDDGSGDASAACARAAIRDAGLEAVARVEVQPNAGPGAARNRGARQARGRYLAFLDSDDLWFPGTLAVVAEAIARDPDAVLFFLRTLDWRVTEPPAPPPPEAPAFERHAGFLEAVRCVPAMRFASSNVVIRRDVFAALGGFTERVRCSEDTDLFLRADRAGPCVLVHRPALVRYAIAGEGSLTANAPCVIEGFDYMLGQEAAGRYPGGREGDPRRTALLAGSAVYTVRVAFATGHAGAAYRLLFRHLGLMRRGGRRRWIPRLLMTPLLALLRPRSYPFRLRPS